MRIQISVEDEKGNFIKLRNNCRSFMTMDKLYTFSQEKEKNSIKLYGEDIDDCRSFLV